MSLIKLLTWFCICLKSCYKSKNLVVFDEMLGTCFIELGMVQWLPAGFDMKPHHKSRSFVYGFFTHANAFARRSHYSSNEVDIKIVHFSTKGKRVDTHVKMLQIILSKALSQTKSRRSVATYLRRILVVCTRIWDYVTPADTYLREWIVWAIRSQLKLIM